MKTLRNILLGAATLFVFGSTSANISFPEISNEKSLGYYIAKYTGTEYRKKVLQEAINRVEERSDLYMPLFKKYAERIKSKGVDISLEDFVTEMNALEIVESWGETRCISTAGAEGCKQIMPETAKLLGLKRNDLINESFDPIKATDASLRFIEGQATWLGSLDWAYVSYNGGPKIAATLKKTHYSPLTLDEGEACTETRQYTWKIKAVASILKDKASYGFQSNKNKIKLSHYYTKRGDNLNSISKKYNASVEKIMEYNSLRKPDKIYPGYVVNIPQKKI